MTVGGTTGFEVPLNLLPVLADRLTIIGSIMGTLEDMKNMMNLIAQTGIKPEIGSILPMEHAEEALRAMANARHRRVSNKIWRSFCRRTDRYGIRCRNISDGKCTSSRRSRLIK